jgi:hypothetical protein
MHQQLLYLNLGMVWAKTGFSGLGFCLGLHGLEGNGLHNFMGWFGLG